MDIHKQDNGGSSGQDVRQGCCWRGEVFFNSLKAMLSRILYILHAFITIWRVAIVLGGQFWAIAAILVAIVAEALVVMIRKQGQEWKWFQPVVLIYLVVEIPCIWLLELEKTSQIQIKYNSSDVILGSLVKDDGPITVNLGSITISHDWWTLILEQSMLVLIIIARWLMPKGELTREQLSALLLYYLGTASDVVDFFSVLSEDETKLLDLGFPITILCFWSWSMLQFIFVATMTAEITADEEEEDEEEERRRKLRGFDIFNEAKNPNVCLDCSKVIKKLKSIRNQLRTFIESEAWVIFVSMLMQDGPFAIVRLVCLFHWGITTYTNYFFTLKNILMLILQLYRLWAVYSQYREIKQKDDEERQQDRKRKWRLSILKSTAFVKGNNKVTAESSDSSPRTHRDDLKRYIREHHRVSISEGMELSDI